MTIRRIIVRERESILFYLENFLKFCNLTPCSLPVYNGIIQEGNYFMQQSDSTP